MEIDKEDGFVWFAILLHRICIKNEKIEMLYHILNLSLKLELSLCPYINGGFSGKRQNPV